MTSPTIDLDQLYDDFSELRWVFVSRRHKHSDYQEPALLSTLIPPASTDKPTVEKLCNTAHDVLTRIRHRLNNGHITAFVCPQETRDILERLWSLVDSELWPVFADPRKARDYFLQITADDHDHTLWHFQKLFSNLQHYAFLELGTLIARTSGNGVAEYLGDGLIRIPGEPEPIRIPQAYVRLVEFLIERRNATTSGFKDAQISDNPSVQFGRLIKRYPVLAPYITRPGKEGKGQGYSTTIKDARQRA